MSKGQTPLFCVLTLVLQLNFGTAALASGCPMNPSVGRPICNQTCSKPVSTTHLYFQLLMLKIAQWLISQCISLPFFNYWHVYNFVIKVITLFYLNVGYPKFTLGTILFTWTWITNLMFKNSTSLKRNKKSVTKLDI